MNLWLRRLKRGVLGAIGLFLMFVISGLVWPLQVHDVLEKGAGGTPPTASGAEKPFVGLALSGGGARAALFGAAGMEALAKRGLLADVTHVSSVSGGGFPASYLATHPIPDCTTSNFPNPCYSYYFRQMRKAIGRDFFWDLTQTQLLAPWRLMRPSSRLSSLQEALDDAYLGKAGFSGIKDRRAFYFNTVSYDTGQRFVFSNHALPAPDFEGAALLPAAVRALSFSSRESLRTTPDDFSLALAVATSAAFPPYLGPLTLQIGNDEDDNTRFRHLGDGGVLENSGVETLREAAIARDGLKSGLIYAFNGGQSLDKDLSQKKSDLSIFSTDLPQFVDVLLEYAGGQREAFFEQFMINNGIGIEVVSFDYLDVAKIVSAPEADFPRWTSWDTWTLKCAASVRRSNASPAQYLKDIPTDLRITRCNAALIEEAARFLVEQCLRETPAQGCFSARRQMSSRAK